MPEGVVQKTFGEIAAAKGKTSGSGDDAIKVDSILNLPIEIIAVNMSTTQNGMKLATITLSDGRKVRTSSKILLDQCADIRESLDSGVNSVSATIVKRVSRKTGYTYNTFK